MPAISIELSSVHRELDAGPDGSLARLAGTGPHLGRSPTLTAVTTVARWRR